MKTLEKLKIIQLEWVGIIKKAYSNKNAMLEILAETRNEIEGLIKLQPKYPKSELINERIKEHESLLTAAQQKLAQIDESLPRYQAKLDKVNAQIKTLEEKQQEAQKNQEEALPPYSPPTI